MVGYIILNHKYINWEVMEMADELNICIENFNELVDIHLPYIIRTISDLTGRYVSVEHDEEFVIALSAFAEAIQRYDRQRGNFLSYVGLVIRSRLLTFLQEEKNCPDVVSLDALMELGYEPEASEVKDEDLHEEILAYQQELEKFGLSLDTMVECSPNHRNTRETAILVAEQASRDEEIVSDTYRKRKLPVRAVARLCHVTEKIVKTSKHFILGTMLIFVMKLSSLIFWIKESR